jgi:tRNA A-37 threonylcarbamoyl transferase component Bud32
VTDKGRPEDDDDHEMETIAGDTKPPRDVPTEPDADFVSLPPRLPARPPGKTPVSPAAPKRKLPEPDPDEPETGELPTMVEATLAGPAAPPTVADPAAPGTETPTKEVDVQREMPTIVGSFAASNAGQATSAEPEEAETIVEPGSAGPSPTPGTSQPARAPYRSPLGKAGASRTARDPVVGSAASRGTSPGAGHAVAVSLSEGQLLADRYELIERLGKGGMGEVWKAKHTLLQGMRAIKVIKASISKDPSFRQRFLQEGQTMMRVKDPGVVEVTDLDETRQNRELFMVMEYLKGRTIYDAVRSKDKPLAADVREAVRILREVALGMQRIHDERIVHKDLKTDNVLLVTAEDGLEHPKVIDFGLAKRLGDKDAAPVESASPSPGALDSDLHTTLSGTLAYMAPEQFRHEASSFQSDIYAFGVMAYEVFTKGEYPVPRGPLQHYLELHTKGTAAGKLAQKRPDLDPKLTAIFDRCIETDRARRPDSFQDVADKLKYWLDTPERLARQRRNALFATAGVVLLAGSIWGVFFAGEKTAALSNPTVAVGGSAARLTGGTYYVGGDALARFEFSADIAGQPGVASLEVDDRAVPVTASVDGKRFVARADLSALADGEHRVAIQPSAGAAATVLVVDVDRIAPAIRGIVVRGAAAGPAGVFSNSQSPEVLVDVGEAASRISQVESLSKSGTPVTAQRDGESDRWVLKGTSEGEGPVDLTVTVRDHAGNSSQAKFAYVRDTKRPELKITDQQKKQVRDIPAGVRVRSAAGAKLSVTVDEAADVTAAIGDLPPSTKRADARATVEFELPPLDSVKPLPVTITAKDAAQNANEEKTQVVVAPDLVKIMNGAGASRLVLRADAAAGSPDDASNITVFRTYPDAENVRLLARRTRQADGREAAEATPRDLALSVSRVTDEGHTQVIAVPPSAFAEGVWTVTAAVGGGTQVVPLEVVSDATPPKVVSVSVAQADGRELKPGDYALAPDIVVTAVVDDLDPVRVDLEGAKRTGELGPGSRTYTFARKLDREGTSTFTLAVADGAGHTVEQIVSVNGDWSEPTIELSGPTGEGQYDDVELVAFSGRCSEPRFKLHVELPDGTPLTANCNTAEFNQQFKLPAGDPLVVAVYAEDEARHRSPRTTLRLRVIHRETELPPEIAWTKGVAARMEKVVAGDVVIGGRVRPVALAFVDRCEVTNRDYRKFLEETKGGHGPWCAKGEPKGWNHTPTAATWNDPKWNADDLPVVSVAYWDARAFAAWSGRRLATEAEWVKAAAKSRSPGEADLRPWPPFAVGEEWRNGVVVTSDWAKGPASAVAGADVSPVGCLHMGGNVSEWIELPEAVEGSTAGTRGGSWFFTRRAADVRGTPAKAWEPSFRANTIGFRCAVDASQVRP